MAIMGMGCRLVGQVRIKIHTGTFTMGEHVLWGNHRYMYRDSAGKSITVSDSAYQVDGDTVKLLTGMFKMFESQSKRQMDDQEKSRKEMQSAVDYINSLPEWLKRGVRYDAYIKATRARGYRQVKVRPKQSKQVSKTL